MKVRLIIREQNFPIFTQIRVMQKRAVSIETDTINRSMDSITEKLTALQKKIDDIRDQNGQRE